MTLEVFTIHISGIDVAKPILETNERLAGLIIEENRRKECITTLNALKSQSFIKFSLPRDSGVGYEPVPVVGGDKYLVVGIGIEDGMPRLGGAAIPIAHL
jgi:hypothetical protein